MEEAGNKAPSAQDITAIKAAILNAQTIQEVAELEKALVTGHVPSQFKVRQFHSAHRAINSKAGSYIVPCIAINYKPPDWQAMLTSRILSQIADTP